MKKKKTHLPRYKSGWGIWRDGGGLHYVDKSGNFKHASMKEKIEDIKPKMMTKTKFKKMFDHLLSDKEYMKFVHRIK